MASRFLYRTQTLPAKLEDVYNFFSDPRNLGEITPPFLNFTILTPSPIEVNEGTIIEYRLSLHGFKLKWVSKISAWNPPYYFIDEQIQGPYKSWVHEHIFESSSGKTIVNDKVSYEVPGKFMEPLIHRLFVQPDLMRIFNYRTETLDQIWENKARNQNDS